MVAALRRKPIGFQHPGLLGAAWLFEVCSFSSVSVLFKLLFVYMGLCTPLAILVYRIMHQVEEIIYTIC